MYLRFQRAETVPSDYIRLSYASETEQRYSPLDSTDFYNFDVCHVRIEFINVTAMTSRRHDVQVYFSKT